MASNRISRINEEIQRELASLIPGVKDPRVSGMISVTGVDTTPDLKYAKVYISVLDKQDCQQVLKGLLHPQPPKTAAAAHGGAA